VAFVIGLFSALAASVLDLLVGLPTLLWQLATDFDAMVAAFGSILTNPGALLVGMVAASIAAASAITPASWKAQWPEPTPDEVLNATVAIFQPVGYQAPPPRVGLSVMYTAGDFIGLILGAFVFGGLSIFAMVKGADKFSKVGKAAREATKGAEGTPAAVKEIGEATGKGARTAGPGANKGLRRASAHDARYLDDAADEAFNKARKGADRLQRQAFLARPESTEILNSLAELRVANRLRDPADVERVIRYGFKQAQNDGNWRGFVNEIRQAAKDAKNLPDGWKLRLTGAEQGVDIEFFDPEGVLKYMRQEKKWARHRLDNEEGMKIAAGHAKSAAVTAGLDPLWMKIRFNLEDVAGVTPDDLKKWRGYLKNSGVTFSFE
jgi:hypothetical protein